MAEYPNYPLGGKVPEHPDIFEEYLDEGPPSLGPYIKPHPEGNGDAIRIGASTYILGTSIKALPVGTENAIHELMRALRVTHKLLKEALRNDVRFMAPNEYRRELNSLSQKTVENIECIDTVLRQVMAELYHEMFSCTSSGGRRKHRRKKNRR